MPGVFRVHGLKDDIYQVWEYADEMLADKGTPAGEFCHQGSLADCYAYIMLRDRGAI